MRYNSSTEGLRRIEAAQPPAEAAAAAAGGAVGDAAERDRGREASTADGGGGAGAAAAGPKAGKARAAAAAGGAGQRTRWACVLKDGATVEADRVILATGGLSFPAVGTDGTGHRIAREQLGHSLNDPYPALVPLTGAHPVRFNSEKRETCRVQSSATATATHTSIVEQPRRARMLRGAFKVRAVTSSFACVSGVVRRAARSWRGSPSKRWTSEATRGREGGRRRGLRRLRSRRQSGLCDGRCAGVC